MVLRQNFVALTRPRWALLAALGAAFVASSITYSLSAPIYSFIDFGDRVTPLWTAMAIGAFAGAAVARAAGGPLGVLAFAAYLAAGATITIGGAMLYERAIQGSNFYFIAVSAGQLALWQLPSAIALVAGSRAGPRFARMEHGTNAFLEAAGAYSLAPLLLVFVGGPMDPRLAPYNVFGPAPIHVALVAAQAIVAGVVFAWRSRGPAPASCPRRRIRFRRTDQRDAGRLHDPCRRDPFQLDGVLAAFAHVRAARYGIRRGRGGGARTCAKDPHDYSVNSPGAIFSRPPR